MPKVLIIGATSAIAEATTHLFAASGDCLYLVGRNPKKLQTICDDLLVRYGQSVSSYQLDVNDFAKHKEVLEEATQTMNGLDIVLIAHGSLPDQKKCENSVEETLQEFKTNALSVISILTLVANYFEEQGYGSIAVISSVAGDRGRQSNYIYGTAKGTITLFLQGLRNRLHKSKINVLTIKPGFVDTPMTASFNKGLLWARPEKIAKGIYSAIKHKRDVVYLPWYWYWIMTIIKVVPEVLFKRLKL